MLDIINAKIFTKANKELWDDAKPFRHLVLNNFFKEEFAQKMASEFPDPNGNFWHEYQNKIEIKKTICDWNQFSKSIYQALIKLLSEEVNYEMSQLVGEELMPDYGLHGGGIHCHKAGGKLNTHLDYTIHPKTDLMRRVNIIIYMTPDWNPTWNGSLGLWEHDSENNKPGELTKQVECLFNRAVIFDTTQNSWHGLPDPVKCPENISRNSLAVYYTCKPFDPNDERKRALFAPSKDQENDPEIFELIKKRADVNKSSEVYKK